MKLLSLTAKNYRTLQNIQLTFSKNYCTISGKNNAGKSCIIRLLSALLKRGGLSLWYDDNEGFNFKEDFTQWNKQSDDIEIIYNLELTKNDDPALISFVERIASIAIQNSTASLKVKYILDEKDNLQISVLLDEKTVDDKAAKEIDKKIKDSNLLFLYNSTTRHEELYYGRSRRRLFYEFLVSEDERKELDEAGKYTERRLRRLAKEHKQGLNNMMGRLTEKYDVEFSTPEGYSSRRMPLGINLKDNNVEVPLNDWGSGTQNRTHILMSILQANRIKTTDSPDDKITPIVVIEEPESFLHPSAQAEFGRVLRNLANEFGIQTMVTTHSPYMLNQEDPSSNILLCRVNRKRKAFETKIVDTTSEKWMAPFADHLGITPEEFNSWRPLFSSFKSKILLVEGSLDKEYFELFQQNSYHSIAIDKDIEVVPYGGKDTLKNILLVQFVLSKFDQVFITYDLDAAEEIKNSLKRLGLTEGTDFTSLGVNQPGKESIEGLLPERVLASVNGRETNLVMRLHSKVNSERRDARDKLKKKYLEEFKANTDYTADELKNLDKVFKLINLHFIKSDGKVRKKSKRA